MPARRSGPERTRVLNGQVHHTCHITPLFHNLPGAFFDSSAKSGRQQHAAGTTSAAQFTARCTHLCALAARLTGPPVSLLVLLQQRLQGDHLASRQTSDGACQM